MTQPSTRPVVLIAEELSPATVEALGPDFEIRSCDGANRDELLPAIADVDAILVRSATKVDAEALAAARRLKVIARAGVGLDNVDVRAATQNGVMVVNAPTSNIVSAAELAVRARRERSRSGEVASPPPVDRPASHSASSPWPSTPISTATSVYSDTSSLLTTSSTSVSHRLLPVLLFGIRTDPQWNADRPPIP